MPSRIMQVREVGTYRETADSKPVELIHPLFPWSKHIKLFQV